MQIEHVSGIGFAAGGPFQDEGDLAIGDSVLGKIIVYDQRIHSVVHKPFAHGATGKRGEVLIGGGIRGAGADDDRVRHRARFFQDRHNPRHVGLFLPDGDVNAIERAVIRFGFISRFVLPRLADNRIDANRRLAGRTIADDQLALAAANGNHRVHGHDARLHRLADGFSLDNARRDLFDRIKRFGGHRSFAIERLAEGIDHAAEQ